MQAVSAEDAALQALNARERKELADGQAQLTPEHDRGSEDGSEGSPQSDVTTGPSMLQQCRDVHCFEKLNSINEGTYGMLFRPVNLSCVNPMRNTFKALVALSSGQSTLCT